MYHNNKNTKEIVKVHLNMVHNTLDEAQNKLQRGFTKDTSPTCGSLLLTEAIAESVDNGKPLYTAFIKGGYGHPPDINTS